MVFNCHRNRVFYLLHLVATCNKPQNIHQTFNWELNLNFNWTWNRNPKNLWRLSFYSMLPETSPATPVYKVENCTAITGYWLIFWLCPPFAVGLPGNPNLHALPGRHWNPPAASFLFAGLWHEEVFEKAEQGQMQFIDLYIGLTLFGASYKPLISGVHWGGSVDDSPLKQISSP